MAYINPDFVNPLVSLLVDNHERAHYYSELVNAAFLALFWLVSFILFFEGLRLFFVKKIRLL